MNDKERCEVRFVSLLQAMELCLATINDMKKETPAVGDVRALSVASTHLETAMLWVANAEFK